MNYFLRRRGEDLGGFSLEELHRRRESGELSGSEYVQQEGAPDWQPLDAVLREGYRVTPPQLPPPVPTAGPNPAIIGTIIVFGILIFVAMMVWYARLGFLATRNSLPGNQGIYTARPDGVAIASKKILWNKNTLTVADVNKRSAEFRTRQWLDGYEKRGERNPKCDGQIIQFLQTWIDSNYGGTKSTNSNALVQMSEQLAADTNCTDPLILTIIANNSLNQADVVPRYERALAIFPDSLHKAYPKFYATVCLTRELSNRPERISNLDYSALQLLPKCFADGSFTTTDQQEIAEIFINGWGYNFFYRNTTAVCKIAHEAGKNYKWLALVLDGEKNIIDAWRARGGGYADTVSEQGWQSFRADLFFARNDLTAAWKLHDDWPLAPERMIYVSLGDADIVEMRRWFDRTTVAQIDYPRAWSDFRWGLRPRWYGSEAAILALGKAAVDTGRFDTDVPRKFFDCVADVESESSLNPGEHLYGRADIWPELQKMYEGYISAVPDNRDGWRSTYAAVAYFAGKYDVARQQLQALNWKPLAWNLTGWNRDLSLMPLEVAARTGFLSNEIANAEYNFENNPAVAWTNYQFLSFDNRADNRTKEFIHDRLVTLELAQHLQKGEWINFLPAQAADPNWMFSLGKIQALSDGAVEAQSAPSGHVFYCRTQISTNFEVKGEFEVVQASEKNFFQAGVNFGDTTSDQNNWDSFRMRRYNGGDAASIGHAWTKSETFRFVTLDNATNTFDFIFKDGRATAVVNGTEIFHQARPVRTLEIVRGTFTIGLGANTQTGAIIRYRNVQLRQLN
jgi:hypothetical protein